MDSWQELLIHAVMKTTAEYELQAVLLRAARDLGFEYYAYGLRVPLPVTRPRIIMLNNYPAAWQQRYREANYLAVDPTVAHGMRSLMPLVWSDEIFAGCPMFWDEAKAHNLRVGWAQSCYNAKAVGGMLTLARSCDELSAGELEEDSGRMSWLASVAFERLTYHLLPKLAPDTAARLSAREIEVLRWTADGKTSSDISEIMSTAERTVNFHASNAIAKLNAGNRTAAAVKAVMLGLLS